MCCFTVKHLASDFVQQNKLLHLQPLFFLKSLIHYCLACLFFFTFLTSTSFLGLCVPPIPHFLLFLLVWLWGLGCRDNRGHRPVSILFAKFLLLQSVLHICCWDGEEPLTTTTPSHTLSETRRREWVLRNKIEIRISSCIYSKRLLALRDCKR